MLLDLTFVSFVSFADITSNILYITKGIESNQPRFLHRAVRQNVNIRKYITSSQLSQLVDKYIPTDSPNFNNMKDAIKHLPIDPVSADDTTSEEEKGDGSSGMDIDEPSESKPITPIQSKVLSVIPEVEIYIFTLIITTLLRHNINEQAAVTASLCIEYIRSFNRRSLDVFSSKAYFYYSYAYERLNKLDIIRPILLSLYRTTCVRHDDIGQSVLLNLLLRNYLHYSLYDQAHTLSIRSNFPETASNNQLCRYLYYMGTIQAIQLEYSESYQRLMMATRKAPQGYASGFITMVSKLMIIVQLLMGDIPERSMFNQPDLMNSLKPYFHLTQAVRNGDLIQFNKVVEEYSNAFQQDKTFTLVQRLGHNVIKTGLRKISVSYTRVALQDIATKLHLQSIESAEYICAKAIR
jgi:26S proteasome regulatory subunit N3